MKKLILLLTHFLITGLIISEAQVLIKDIYPGKNHSNPYFLCPSGNGCIFFSEDGQNGRELWYTDGSTQNTYMLADVNPGQDGCGFLWPFEDTGFSIQIISNSNQFQFWKTDGTQSGTSFKMGLNKYGPITFNGQFIKFKSKYYFQNYDSINGYELWVTDLDWANPHLFKNIVPNDSILKETQINGLIEFDNSMYFIASDTNYKIKNYQSIYKSDGTDTGTHKINSIKSNPSSYLYKYGSDIFFIGQADTGAAALYRYNTNKDSLEIIYQNANDRILSDLLIRNNLIYFRTYNYINSQFSSWVYNSNTSSIQKFKLSEPGINSFFIGLIEEFDSFTLLAMYTDVYGYEYWKLDKDGLGASFILDFKPGPSGSISNDPLISKNGKAYFILNNSSSPKIWETDGTSGNTRIYYEFGNGVDITQIHQINGQFIVFGMLDSAFGYEIFNLDLFSSIDNHSTNNINIYPNPVKAGQTLNIGITDSVDSIKLYDMRGIAINLPIENGLCTIPDYVHSGLYILLIQQAQKKSILKLKIE